MEMHFHGNDFDESDSETELLLEPINKREIVIETPRNRRKQSVGRMRNCLRMFCG